VRNLENKEDRKSEGGRGRKKRNKEERQMDRWMGRKQITFIFMGE